MSDLERFALMETNRHLIDERDDLRAENERLRAELIGEENLLRQNVEAVELAEQLQAELDQAYTKLRYALAAVEKSTNLMNDLLYDPSMETWHDKKIIYQIAENQAVLVLQPTEIGEK